MNTPLNNWLKMTPREALQFSICPKVIIGLCWYFCFFIGNNILQDLALFDIFIQLVLLFLSLGFGFILGIFLFLIIETIFANFVKRHEYNKNLKLTRINLEARLKYQKTNQKNRTLNSSINLTNNQILYVNLGRFCSIDINFLRDSIVITPIQPPGSRKYTVKYMLKDIAVIGFVSLLLHSLAMLLNINLNLLFLLVSALLIFGVAHLWVGLVWPFISKLLFWCWSCLWPMLLCLKRRGCLLDAYTQ